MRKPAFVISSSGLANSSLMESAVPTWVPSSMFAMVSVSDESRVGNVVLYSLSDVKNTQLILLSMSLLVGCKNGKDLYQQCYVESTVSIQKQIIT